ncbi:PREDICTED: putative lipase ROG1 isoform X1 [Camelina sativa]|uniref:Lipase ROG1 isoform X1 n=1 Tax=Camelina sativa TaxID=90675 RepID=A0ABM0XT13_CAMSA|nr:PREDICTED: putative lipase ROG1 isoform X1 [Camelina sativa]
MEEKGCAITRNTEEDMHVVGSDLKGTGGGSKKTRRSGKSGDKETKKKNKTYWMGCLRAESDESGNVDFTVDFPGERTEPTHLVVMVNGLIGSAQNWRFAAKQMLKTYPQGLLVHCSKRNHSTQTFSGVDVMGERLAEEVRSVIKRHPSLQKISFVGHSLGGLVARYAIGRLYEQESREELPQNSEDIGDTCPIEEPKERIAGLEPMYFITSATPHLGSRGHKQVPLFSGSHTLERLATRMSWCLGKTGKHLFLADSDDGKPPLLLRMVSDSRDLKFISALRCFKRRIAYANTSFDHLVGWSTSSIRRRNELPKLQRGPVNEKYPHIVNIEPSDTASNHEEDQSGSNSNGFKNFDMEEEMIRELTKVSWERVDVSFRGTLQRFLAHNTIQVKTKMINSAGADVIQHMIDNFEP